MHGDEHQQVKQQYQWQREMWESIPLQDCLVQEAAGSSLGRAEPMAWQGGVLGLPGQQVKQSAEAKHYTLTALYLCQGQSDNNSLSHTLK